MAINEKGFDLHTHSRASDGFLAPAALVTKARSMLAGMALTDHDSVHGLVEALTAAERQGFPVIPGVEFTTDRGRHELHILAYFVDHRRPELSVKLAKVAEARLERAKEMHRRLVALGFPLRWETVSQQAPGPYVGRPHIMRALIAQGLVQRQQADKFFQAYLARGAPAYVPHQELETKDAIHLALAAGGVPVLAHPGLVGTDDFLPELVEEGLAGLEVHYPRHGPQALARYSALAARYGLVATGGSDFHGEPGGVQLGQAVVDARAVEALAGKAAGGTGQAFLATLHIPNQARE